MNWRKSKAGEKPCLPVATTTSAPQGAFSALAGIHLAPQGTFSALAGIHLLRGHQGNDALFGGAGADQLFGEDGDDTLIGVLDDLFSDDGRTDRLHGGVGFDTYRVGDGDVVSDSDGAGRVFWFSAGEALTGGTLKPDLLSGGIYGSDDGRFVFQLSGATLLFGDAGGKRVCLLDKSLPRSLAG